MTGARKTRTLVWMSLKNDHTDEEVTVTFEEGEDELFVPDDPWQIVDNKRIGLWS